MREPETWDKTFMLMAESLALRSKDPDTQVGAMIVSPDKKRVAIGYNGFISGAKETPEMWKRPEKYKRVLHAENNAILNARCDLTDWTLYVTIPCCSDCAKNIAQAKIKRVVFKRQPKASSQLDYEFAKELLESGGVEVVGPMETA